MLIGLAGCGPFLRWNPRGPVADRASAAACCSSFSGCGLLLTVVPCRPHFMMLEIKGKTQSCTGLLKRLDHEAGEL